MTSPKKSATPKNVPRPKMCHAPKCSTPKNVPRPKMYHAQKCATPKNIPRAKMCHAQIFFKENLPQNGTQMDQKIDQKEKKNSPILFLTMYLYHNIYKSSYNIVTIIIIYKLHDICVCPYIFH